MDIIKVNKTERMNDNRKIVMIFSLYDTFFNATNTHKLKSMKLNAK